MDVRTSDKDIPSPSQHPCYRFLALICISLIAFGSYFCYDNPGSLQNSFINDLGLTQTQFMWLYSIYSWPNVIFCLINGYLIDRIFGIRKGTIIFVLMLLVGQTMFALGAIYRSFLLMISGRFLFGIGSESVAIAQNHYSIVWFKRNELNTVFGFHMVSRIGSAISFIVMDDIHDFVRKYYDGNIAIGIALACASFTLIISFVCSLILALLYTLTEKQHKQQQNTEVTIDKQKQTPIMRFSDIGTFGKTYWFTVLIIVTFYVTLIPFIAVAKQFFMVKFQYTADHANQVTSVVYVISGLISALLGAFIDRYGRNEIFVLISASGSILGQILLVYTKVNPYIGTILMGLSYSLMATSVWPMVALVIPEHQLGTAYGICQAVTNLGLALVSLISGIIIEHEHAGGYFILGLFFLSSLTICLLSTLGIIYSGISFEPKKF